MAGTDTHPTPLRAHDQVRHRVDVPGHPEVPPRVVYELTDLGRSLREPIDAVTNWAKTNFWRINAARQTHDAAG